MNIVLENKIFKDFDKVNDLLLIKVKNIIDSLSLCNNQKEISEKYDIKKMRWDDYYYRIRIWDFRLWISIKNEDVKIIRFLHRKDIYKFFP